MNEQTMTMENPYKIEPEKDLFFLNDQVYYTRSGAMKLMRIGSTTMTTEINKENITVIKHPAGDLFTKQSINEWIEKKTIKARKDKARPFL